MVSSAVRGGAAGREFLRHRRHRICGDRPADAGAVLRHGRIFIRRGDRPQGNADRKSPVRFDRPGGADDARRHLLDGGRHLSAECLHGRHEDRRSVSGDAHPGHDHRGLCRFQPGCEGSMSKAATVSASASQATLAASTRHAGDVVTPIVPSALLVQQTYLIFSEVSYLYTPTIGYVMATTGVTLADVAYTRPREVTCVIYNSLPAATSCAQTPP